MVPLQNRLGLGSVPAPLSASSPADKIPRSTYLNPVANILVKQEVKLRMALCQSREQYHQSGCTSTGQDPPG